MYHKSLKNKDKIFAIAPMMDWTDNVMKSIGYIWFRAKTVQYVIKNSPL